MEQLELEQQWCHHQELLPTASGSFRQWNSWRTAGGPPSSPNPSRCDRLHLQQCPSRPGIATRAARPLTMSSHPA